MMQFVDIFMEKIGGNVYVDSTKTEPDALKIFAEMNRLKSFEF